MTVANNEQPQQTNNDNKQEAEALMLDMPMCKPELTVNQYFELFSPLKSNISHLLSQYMEGCTCVWIYYANYILLQQMFGISACRNYILEFSLQNICSFALTRSYSISYSIKFQKSMILDDKHEYNIIAEFFVQQFIIYIIIPILTLPLTVNLFAPAFQTSYILKIVLMFLNMQESFSYLIRARQQKSFNLMRMSTFNTTYYFLTQFLLITQIELNNSQIVSIGEVTTTLEGVAYIVSLILSCAFVVAALSNLPISNFTLQNKYQLSKQLFKQINFKQLFKQYLYGANMYLFFSSQYLPQLFTLLFIGKKMSKEQLDNQIIKLFVFALAHETGRSVSRAVGDSLIAQLPGLIIKKQYKHMRQTILITFIIGLIMNSILSAVLLVIPNITVNIIITGQLVNLLTVQEIIDSVQGGAMCSILCYLQYFAAYCSCAFGHQILPAILGIFRIILSIVLIFDINKIVGVKADYIYVLKYTEICGAVCGVCLLLYIIFQLIYLGKSTQNKKTKRQKQ